MSCIKQSYWQSRQDSKNKDKIEEDKGENKKGYLKKKKKGI